MKPDELADDTFFFDGGLGLDSVDLMVLVALLDRDYGVQIFSREPGEKVFITLSTLAEKHPKIKDAAVIGVPDRIKGQAILAVIVLREGLQGGKEEFLNYCRENMPDYRTPQAILLRDAIPRNSAGKILKRVLRQEARTN